MSKKTSFAAVFAGLFILSVPATAVAQDTEAGFTFSDALQTSFDTLSASSDAFRSGVEAALDGLTGDDRRDVMEANADEARALRDAERELRDMGVAEMEAAGIEVAVLEGGRPGGPGTEAEGFAGAEAGPDGRGGEGPGGQGGEGSGGRP